MLKNANAEAAPKGKKIPKTLAKPKPGARALRSGGTDFRPTHLGVTWSESAGNVGFRTRTKKGWSEWQSVHACLTGKDGETGLRGALVRLTDTLGYELSATNGDTSTAVELNTVDGPFAAWAHIPDHTLGFGGRPTPYEYLSRRCWGADESYRFKDGKDNFPPEYFPVQTLTVHHTAGSNDDPDPAATIRGIYYLQAVTKDWGDIGYHLLIDESGKIYEGRVSGDDSIPVFGAERGPNGRRLANNAAHVVGYNAGNVAVCLLGDFTSRQPTDAARTSLAFVLGALTRECGLDATGTTNYVNAASGKTKTVRTISGHRDWASTECPGELFYPTLDEVRRIAKVL